MFLYLYNIYLHILYFTSIDVYIGLIFQTSFHVHFCRKKAREILKWWRQKKKQDIIEKLFIYVDDKFLKLEKMLAVNCNIPGILSLHPVH